MKKRLIALSLCLLLVGTLAATATVSAGPPANRMKFDLTRDDSSKIIGSINVCLASGCYDGRAGLGRGAAGETFHLSALVTYTSDSTQVFDWGTKKADGAGKITWSTWTNPETDKLADGFLAAINGENFVSAKITVSDGPAS